MLTITLLGTAATMPLPDRALTAAVAECGGHSLLFDCGEGTQTAARRAGVNLMKMDAVCLTHYHGDHIFGLPGLLQTLGCQGRTRPLALYGPKGLGEVWAALRVLTGPLPYPVYAEVLDAPAALTDCVPLSYYCSTHPDSVFTQWRMVNRRTEDGNVSITKDQFVRVTPEGKETRTVESEEEFRALLEEHFGIVLPA